MRKLILTSPRGFCSGVVRAIDIVETALAQFGAPIYVKHEIVHNRHVVQRLEQQGVIFIEDISSVPREAILIFSAHGVTPLVRQEAEARALKVIDATCVLVTKIHSAVKRYASKGYKIILIGHRQHVEVIGIKGEAAEYVTVVENVDDVEQLVFPSNQPLFYVTQTTLSLDDTQEISQALIKKYPHIITLNSSSICYATRNRQEALKSVLNEDVKFVFVVGDRNSSNSNRLCEVARKRGCEAVLINSPEDILDKMIPEHGNIVMTAGASTPEEIVQACIHKLLNEIPILEIEESVYTEEDVKFGLPKMLLC